MLRPPPNPDSVRTPEFRAFRRVTRMTTRSAGSKIYPVHVHDTVTDRAGNGITTTEAGHAHRVVGWRVVPGDDGHTHGITSLPASIM